MHLHFHAPSYNVLLRRGRIALEYKSFYLIQFTIRNDKSIFYEMFKHISPYSLSKYHESLSSMTYLETGLLKETLQ